jgi:TolB-like protein
MASLVPGYEYDIFISYRQKDNKHDGWVTEFINNLKGELEATFKEDLSIYFDINPHDGILETYSVDKSLESKLKCLIFIPIISQTYCDSKSFAWQSEFCVFNKFSKEDIFGRDIKLSSGNVASRILPIKIHELDPEDKTLLEDELGGALRGIEFIYKSAGVNRPLRADEDHPHDNLNKTYYRDQINKVANSVKEIIAAIKRPAHQDGENSRNIGKVKNVRQENQKSKIILGSLIVLAALLLGYFLIPALFYNSRAVEKSIAVLPFKLLSDEPDKQYLADGMMDAILLHLSKISDLRVISRTSVEQYRGTTKTIKSIGQELDVDYLLEGSFQKYGDNARLIVQLIRVKEEKHVWANEYNSKWDDIFSVQSEIAQTIAKELNSVVTPEEKGLIEKIPTANLTAYDLYIKANDYLSDYIATDNLNSYQKAISFYQSSLEIDSSFAKAYSGLAKAYYSHYFYETFFKENFLDSCLLLANIAISIDNKLDEAYFIRGAYYQVNGHIEEALGNFDKALKINPNFYTAYTYKGYILTWILYDFVKGIENYNKALTLVRGEGRPSLLNNLGRAYLDVGFPEKAKYYYHEAFMLNENKASELARLSWLEFSLENFEEALRLIKAAGKIDSAYFPDLVLYIGNSNHKEEAYKVAIKTIEKNKKSGELNLVESHRVGYALWEAGKYKEAEYYFNQQIRYGKESIKLQRTIGQRKAAQYDIAATYAFLGDKTNAYLYLDEFSNKNFYPMWWISLAKHDPLFNNIRNEERFQRILQNMETKFRAEHEKVMKWLEENKLL